MYTLILHNVIKNLNFHIDNSGMESGRGQVHNLTLQQHYTLLHILVSSQVHHTADFNCMGLFPFRNVTHLGQKYDKCLPFHTR
jgi:hypothetical protein